MTDFQDIAFRLTVGSQIVRVYPNALVQIYENGTSTLITETIADADGEWSIDSLSIGKYDIKVDGQLRKTFHFVPFDHIHNADETWTFFKLEEITGDIQEDPSIPIYFSDVAGKIIKISLIAETHDVTGDITVHLLKGATGGSSELEFPTDSAWEHRIYPAAAGKRYKHVDNNPGINVSADEAITMAIDYSASTVAGITVIAIFRKD